MRPPLAELPDVTLGEEGLDAENAIRLALVGWAARRTGLRITLTGSEDALEAVRLGLGEDAEFVDLRAEGQGDTVSAAWSTASAP